MASGIATAAETRPPDRSSRSVEGRGSAMGFMVCAVSTFAPAANARKTTPRDRDRIVRTRRGQHAGDPGTRGTEGSASTSVLYTAPEVVAGFPAPGPWRLA